MLARARRSNRELWITVAVAFCALLACVHLILRAERTPPHQHLEETVSALRRRIHNLEQENLDARQSLEVARKRARTAAQDGGTGPTAMRPSSSSHSTTINAAAVEFDDIDDFLQRWPLPGRLHGEADETPSAIRICIVSSGFSETTRAGGIGTAMSILAQSLANAKHPDGTAVFKVTALYAAHPYYAKGLNEKLARAAFEKRGIVFETLDTRSAYYGSKFMIRSYKVYEWLKASEHDFDTVVFHDYMGSGYYSTVAKRQGLNFERVTLVVQCHSIARWTDAGNNRPPKDHNTLGHYYMEQKSIEYADIRISPSAFYLRWMINEGMRFPHGHTFVLQNMLSPKPADVQIQYKTRSNHFVFFARLEVLKGLFVFLKAIDMLLADESTPNPSHITFIGPSVTHVGESSVQIIERHINEKWKSHFETSIYTNFNTSQAIHYVKENQAIVVLPTLVDNSPYVVMELIGAQLPLITTTAGGVPELCAPIDEPLLVPPNDPQALARSMQYAMSQGITNMKISVPFSETEKKYWGLYQAFAGGRSLPAEPEPLGPTKRVTVGITTHDRPDELLDSVQSIIGQDYPVNLLHVVVIDDASEDPKSQQTLRDIETRLEAAGLSHEVVRNRAATFVSSTRNRVFELAVEHNSDYACLLDDDDLAKPNMVQTYMDVAERTNADVLSDMADSYDVTEDGTWQFSHRSLAIGNAFAHNFFVNDYGKANFCVKPQEALRIGGHHTGAHSQSPFVDWAFLTRAALNDLHIETLPLALYKYRKASKNSLFYNHRSKTDHFHGHHKMLDDMFLEVPKKFEDVLELCRFQLGKPKVEGEGMI